MERYFFAQDESSHWYMLPVRLKEQWDCLSQKPNGWEYDGWLEIEEHRLDGGIESITFENPQ